MASLQLEEYVIAAAKAKLEAGLAARVAAINAEHADDAQITTPTVYEYGVSLEPSGPLVIVTDGGTPEGGTFTEEGAHSLVYEFQLVVTVKDDDADRDRLGRKLLRYERAVIETLWDDDPKEALTVTVAGNTNLPYIKPFRVVAGPTFNAQDSTSLLSSFRLVVFTVTKREL